MHGDLVQKSAEILDIPENAIAKRIHVEIIDFSTIEVDGYEQIIEYTNKSVKFQLKKGILSIFGDEIILENLCDGSAILRGRIESIEDEA